MEIVNLVLFGVLGLALNWSGIDVFEKPIKFVVIMAIAVAISITSKLSNIM